MSSAGRIYEEKVFAVSEDSAGSRTIDFVVENDGCIVVIERLSGTATVSGSFKTNLPNPMSELLLETFSVSDNTPIQFAHITGAQVRFDLSWDGPTEFRITAKMANGAAVSAVNPAIVIIDTFDGFSTQQVDVAQVVTQVVNTAGRRSVAIRNWSDKSNETLFVKEDNVNVDQGWPLAAGEGISLDVDENTSVYLVADTGTIDVRILEVTST